VVGNVGVVIGTLEVVGTLLGLCVLWVLLQLALELKTPPKPPREWQPGGELKRWDEQ
jgi:hypothetical protein